MGDAFSGLAFGALGIMLRPLDNARLMVANSPRHERHYLNEARTTEHRIPRQTVYAQLTNNTRPSLHDKHRWLPSIINRSGPSSFAKGQHCDESEPDEYRGPPN